MSLTLRYFLSLISFVAITSSASISPVYATEDDEVMTDEMNADDSGDIETSEPNDLTSDVSSNEDMPGADEEISDSEETMEE